MHISDLVADRALSARRPDRVALVELGGARAYLLVPLLKDTAVLGYVMIYRKDVGPFSDKQIALLQSFAAQAVIAMENARLLDRDARGAGATDRHRGSIAGHQLLARRSYTGVRRDARKGDAVVRGRLRPSCHL